MYGATGFCILPSAQDTLDPLSSKDVWEYLCSCGAIYIDEMGRSMKTGLNER